MNETLTNLYVSMLMTLTYRKKDLEDEIVEIKNQINDLTKEAKESGIKLSARGMRKYAATL